MSDIEKADNIKPSVGGIIAEVSQLRNDVDAGKLNPQEFDEWLKHNIVKYRYPLLGATVISAGWLAYGSEPGDGIHSKGLD